MISSALIQLENLRNICRHHKEVCIDNEDCNISIYLALETAKILLFRVHTIERQQAEKIIKDWPL